MFMGLKAICVTCLLFSVAEAAEIKVMISGGFSPAFQSLVGEFERTTKHQVVVSRGASMGDAPTSIPSRVRRGEPVDVFIMVGDALDDLEKQGHVVSGSRVDLARSRLGMAVREGATKPNIATVDEFKQTLLEAKSVAVSTSASGRYFTTELFPRLGIADQMREKTLIIGVTGGAVARGEADIAMQQISELLPISGLEFVGPLPEEVQKVTIYAAGIATGARAPKAARDLILFLSSPEAASAIARTALEPVAPQ
ncbi:MAG: substrate-binding domain-containing protein [Acidobacteria bacterium]|nr:substrate-binding domain-containing protein [Acidobacteriota bacterium]